MRRNKAWWIFKGVAIAMVAAIFFSIVVQQLWNRLVPQIFGLQAITIVQALGLLILCKILFGSFHRGGGGGRRWRKHMDERWASMTEDERERFRAGMRSRRGCRTRGEAQPGPQPGPVQTGA